MNLGRFLEIFAEELNKAGAHGLDGDLRMVNKLCSEGKTTQAKHFIEQFLVDDARPMVHAFWKSVYQALKEGGA